jgi:5S rRNA maturation endonuclease (ribonuclease M5)
VELDNAPQQQQVAYAASKVAEYLAIKQTKEQQQRLGQIIAEQTGLSEFKIEAISKEIYLLSEPDKLAAYLAKQEVKQELLPQQLSSSGKEELMILLQRDGQGKIINLVSYDVKENKYQLLLSNNDNEDNNSDSGLFGLEQIKHHQDVILCNSVIEAKILQQSSEFSDVGVIAAINGKLNKRDLAILHHLNIRSLNILAAKDEKMQQFNNRLGIVRQLMPKTAILVTELNEADGSVISDYQLKAAQVKAAKLILSNRENIGSYYGRRLRDSYHKFGFKISIKTDVIFRQRVQNIVKQLDVVEAGRLFDDLVVHGFAKREDEYLLNLTTNIKLNSRESREEIKEYIRNNNDVNEVKQEIYNKTARYLLAQAASKPDDLMAYLEQRGFKAGMSNIGYLSNIGHLRQYLSHQGFEDKDISQYLPFWQDFAEQNKLIMAIRDEDGQVQGFVGRDISGLAKRKYLYTKGMKVRDNLLGIELCKLGDEVILVEGIIDAVQVNNQHLRQKALALGGVGISDQQLALLQQLKPSKIYLALDKDEAGQQSQLEVIGRLNEAGFRQNLAVLNWDLRHKDIDELIAKETISSVESSISSAGNVVEHYAAIITSKYGSKPLTITQQLECKEQVEKILSHLDSEQQIELMERFDEAGLSRQVAINIINQQQKQQLFKLSQEELAGFAPALKGYKQYMLKHSAAIKQELNIFSEDDVRQVARGYCGAAEQEIEQGIVDHILQQEIIARPELGQVIEQGARVITNKLSIKEALFTEQNVRAYVIELFKQLKLEGVKEEVVAEIVQQVLSHQQIVKLERLSLRGQQYYSTQSYLKREEQVKQLAGSLSQQRQQFKQAAITIGYHYSIMNDDQDQAYQALTGAKGGIEIIRGIAGTGKSTLLEEYVKNSRSSCRNIHGLAVSTVVVNSLKAIGIEAKTIANIMSERSNFAEQVQANDAIIVDEAAMLDMKQMQHIMQLAFDKKCKLILVGDDGQVQPINGGQPFKLLAEQLPGNVHELKQVIRRVC